ncbi:MAG: class I SAM-dependent methyltransferase, partial [Spirochaetaceae bacterium]|nr:class I SAM-dependent methyltransferase [Spirochaetaceae bacterium]
IKDLTTTLPLLNRYAKIYQLVEKEWFEEEWFWYTFCPIMFDSDLMAGTPEEVDGLLELTGLSHHSKILDLCCGFGRHSLEMAKRGLQVEGIDITESYINRARKNAKRQNLDCSFRLGDVRTMEYKEEFDAVVCMWNSFGYTEESDDDELILSKMRQALRPGGILLMDTPGKEVIASGFEANTWFERDDLKILLEYSIELNWTVLKNRWLFFKDTQMKEFQFSQRIYSALELAQMLYKQGFDDIDIWGSWQGDPYDDKAQRLIVIGKKLND